MKGSLCALLPFSVVGHSQLYEPPTRGSGGIAVGQPNCAGGGCLFFNNGAFIGCPTVTGGWWNASLCPQGTIEPTVPFGHKKFGTIFMEDDYCEKFPADCQENPDEFQMWEPTSKLVFLGVRQARHL
jgi:MoaA/NifB/PqqE/SkfB family radical SAM enzyme